MKNDEKDFYRQEKNPKTIWTKCHKRRNIRQTVYQENVIKRPRHRNIYRGFLFHATYGKLRRKYDKPQGRQNSIHQRRQQNSY